MALVPIDYEYPLYIPDYLLRMKAKERVAYLMKKQAPTIGTITDEQLQEASPNEKMSGLYVTKKPGPDHVALIVPCLGEMTADELRYTVGLYTEGGYGKGPELRSKDISKRDWKCIVTNAVDYLVESRRRRNRFTIST